MSVEFFEPQFQRQVKAGEFELNPFERLALEFVHGRVLELGCGLGNLALEVARRGCTVTAVDASPTAVERIRAAAQREGLAVEPVQADIRTFEIPCDYETIVAIGLLMFFHRPRALALLKDIQAHVLAGGRAIVNVLVEGTTYMEMFKGDEYYLFGRDEVTDCFADWALELARHDEFPAPGNTVKAFATVIARRPGRAI